MAHSRSPSISSSPDKTPDSSTTKTGADNSGPKTMRPPPKPPASGLSKVWSKVEMTYGYVWLVIQVLLLLAGLTVLNFATLMVVLSYSIYGYFKPRREFLSYSLEAEEEED